MKTVQRNSTLASLRRLRNILLAATAGLDPAGCLFEGGGSEMEVVNGPARRHGPHEDEKQ